MKATVFDIQGNKSSEITLNEDLFSSDVNAEVLGQYYRVFKFNQRQGTVSTKTRGEVAGSGAKPWNQKHTGRARVGDKRNPIWRHGGISHGPKPRSWNLDLPKKTKIIALISALSEKAAQERVIVLDSLTLDTIKTKSIAEMAKKLDLNRNVLFVLEKTNNEVTKSLRNIKGLSFANVARLNAFEIMSSDKVVFTKDSLNELVNKYIEQ